MSDTKYLKQRHQTWYVRVRVPPSLKPVLGYELSRTTATRDLRVARQLRWSIVADLKQRIAEAEARRVLGERDSEWVLNAAKRLARDVREGTTDHALALEVGLEDIRKRHFKAAEYPIDPETGHPMIASRAAQAAVDATSKIVHAGDVMLMSHAVDTFLAEIEDRVINTTWTTKERMLGDLQRFLGDPELSRVTKQSCGEYLTKHLMTAGRSVKTTKNTLTHLLSWSDTSAQSGESNSTMCLFGALVTYGEKCITSKNSTIISAAIMRCMVKHRPRRPRSCNQRL